MNGAEISTVLSIFAVDFFMQLWMMYQIINLKSKVITDANKTEARKKKKEKAVMKLVLAEFVEGLVPLSYAIGFAMAYLGPNAHLTGNVLSDLWAYNKVEDVGKLFLVLFLLIGVDCCSVVLNAFLLSKFGNVNLLQEFSNAMKHYWFIFVILQTLQNCLYFCFNDINMAMDLTTQFTWITSEGRLTLIHNSTDLTDYEKDILIPNESLT